MSEYLLSQEMENSSLSRHLNYSFVIWYSINVVIYISMVAFDVRFLLFWRKCTLIQQPLLALQLVCRISCHTNHSLDSTSGQDFSWKIAIYVPSTRNLKSAALKLSIFNLYIKRYTDNVITISIHIVKTVDIM